MGNKLKQYYAYIIERDGAKVRCNHDKHHAFCKEINSIKKLIKSGNDLWKQDQGFLKRLLYTKDNGIASRGQSNLSKEQFYLFIKNKSFMSALAELIINPTGTTLEHFEKVWRKQKGSNNPVRTRRVAAASTLEVSTTVDMPKFNKVFKWLITEKIIPEYSIDESQYTKAQRWFIRNQFLMKEIKKQFKDELKNGAIDKIYLSHFVWYLYEHSKPFHSKRKIRISR